MSFSQSVGRLSLMLLLGAVGCAETHRLDLQIDRPSGVDGPLVVQVASVPGGRCEGAPPMDWSSAGSVSVGEGAQAIWVRAWDEACENCSLGCSMADIAQGASPSVSLMPVDCAGFPCRMLPEGGVDAGDASRPIDEDAGDGGVGSDAGDSGEPVPDGCAGRRVLAAGPAHVCFAPGDRSVRCWGNSEGGRLGAALSFDADVCELSLGDDFGCVALSDGSAHCWGSQVQGRLGNGMDSGSSSSPRRVLTDDAGLSGVASVAVGSSHACATTDDGTPYCWGYNPRMQAGSECGASCLTAAEVPLREASLVAAGYGVGCSLATTGMLEPRVHCWGINEWNRLRLETFDEGTAPPGPVDVRGGAGEALQLCAGGRDRGPGTQPKHANFVCARFAEDIVCWGLNIDSELGEPPGDPLRSGNPSVVTHGIAGASDIDCGARHTCAVVDGQVRCWGNNTGFVLGSMDPDAVTGSVEIPGGAETVASGTDYSCAVNAEGRVFCWGTGIPLGASSGTSVPTEMTIPTR